MTFIDTTADDYHAVRGLYMTSHRIIAARRSVQEFIRDTREEKADSHALYFGRAAHVYTIEGEERFRQEYVVGGPVNPKTAKTYGTRPKKYQEWADTQPLPAISPEEFALIQRMDRSVKGKRAAQQLLAKGQAEVTGRTDIEGVPCQVRVDWLTRPEPRIVDYKTCADLSTIAVDVEQYGYVIQQAFYRQCVEKLIGVRCPVYLIWCEKTEQPNSVVWRLDDDRLDHEAEQNRKVIREVKEVFFRLVEEKKRCQQQERSSKTSTPQQKAHPNPAAASPT